MHTLPKPGTIKKIYLPLAPGRSWYDFKNVTSVCLTDSYLQIFSWWCPQVNATGNYWWCVNVGSSNGSVPSGLKPQTWANIDSVFCRRVTSLDHHEFINKCILLNENIWISLKISLKFALKIRISNIVALVQIIAWRRPGAKPLSEAMMVSLLTHVCVTRPWWVKCR